MLWSPYLHLRREAACQRGAEHVQRRVLVEAVQPRVRSLLGVPDVLAVLVHEVAQRVLGR